ncbi:transglycosylase family protein [Streptomyces palmae]|uniref:LysM peptidoglycan-binding domain-containing protein n=1 Tax=Streptomyces palmae TaxID=1701085 RepID=A0A4Z0GGH5_9ACTN|nr:transglycosylase family protein [Streptomyces palmae]TGA95616.1 LysM peptidoglycan-binding domain-containing protein [Streptomyces palmae]
MRSGNGRHRRPRQAPAFVVAAGVTGASIAIPLLGATSASAAEAHTWDRVAECESGGLWSANSGNGFYGGLQLTLEMWKHYGGTAYAPRPDLASRSQQIAVAEAMLADRGPQGWPSCSVEAGLTENGKAPRVDPGSIEAPTTDPSTGRTADEPSAPSGTTKPSRDQDRTGDLADSADTEESGTPSGGSSRGADDRGADKNDQDEQDGKGDRGTGSRVDTGDTAPGETGGTERPGGERGHAGAPGTGRTGTTTPGTGKHRGQVDERGPEHDGRTGGRHASRGDGERTGKPAERVRADYTVRTGDNLSAIAEEYRVSGGWPALYQANTEVIGDDPDLILPGQHLELPKAGK